MPKAILFDLDDTLFDHTHSARAGVRWWGENRPDLAGVDTRALEDVYSEVLEAVHVRLLAGALTQAQARVIRTQSFFARFDVTIDADAAEAAYAGYRRAYEAARRVVPGALALLDALRADGRKLGVVTNNVVSEQVPKLAQLGLEPYFQSVVISEAAGVSKPDARIFQIALDGLGVRSDETVMVGDSLRSDIEGAEALGIRTVWLDRRGESTDPAPPRSVLRSFEPHEAAVRAVLGTEC